MIFGLFPDDFDHVEFGAVWWKIAEEGVVFYGPAIHDALVDVVVYFGVVKNDEGWNGFGDAWDEVFHEIDEDFTIDRTGIFAMVEALIGKVEGAQDGNFLMMGRCGFVRFADRRPGALHWRRSGKSRTIKIEQLKHSFPAQCLQAVEFLFDGLETLLTPFFLRLQRVRLKLKPRDLRTVPIVSNVQGTGHP